jgi:fermentation-respiration switch protein FrsA (DUF1100 family)
MKADPDVTQVYENAAAIRDVSSPLLIIQGELDDVVPVDQGRAVLAASRATQKEYVEVPGAQHSEICQSPASDAAEHFVESLR